MENYIYQNKKKEKLYTKMGKKEYLEREAAFSLILCMKRPLWKLLPATSEWNFSNG